MNSASESMYRWKYRNWLRALKISGAHFVTAKDIVEGNISLSQCNVFIRHDVDDCVLNQKVWPMLQVEAALDIRSTTYLFSQDPYNFTSQGEDRLFLLKDHLHYFQKMGFDFGLHVDVVPRCQRQENSVDPDEAMSVLKSDLEYFKGQGIEILSMAAHGFRWKDGQRPYYDHYALEFDYSAQHENVLSQFHLNERFCEKGQKLDVHFPITQVSQWQSAYGPSFKSLDWVHSCHSKESLSAQVLSLTDACYIWKFMGVKELTGLIPLLKGCLINLNFHPKLYHFGDDGLEFSQQNLNDVDHAFLPSDLSFVELDDEPAFDHKVKPYFYKAQFDMEEVDASYVSPQLDRDEVQRLKNEMMNLNERLQGPVWFNQMFNPPNSTLIRWIEENIDHTQRKVMKVLELCGGAGPVATGLTYHGFQPENMMVTDYSEAYLKIAQAVSDELFHSKIRVRFQDICNIDLNEFFDLIIVSSWEMKILPYDRAVSEISKILSPSGILVMTFLEKSKIDRFGYNYSPYVQLFNTEYYAIYPEKLMELFKVNNIEPLTYIEYGCPQSRFPRHVMIGRQKG